MIPPRITPNERPQFHNLGEYVFEDLCCDLFEEEPGIGTCSMYGTRGQSQYGIDLLAHIQGSLEIEVGQCKCYEKFSANKIKKVSEKFFADWDHWSNKNIKRFVLFVACDLDRRNQQDEIIKQKELFRKNGIAYEVWSARTIQNKLRPHPGIVRTYLLSQEWVEIICGTVTPKSSMAEIPSEKTSVVVEMAMASQLEQLAGRISDDTAQRIEDMRTVLREGKKGEVVEWLENLKRDSVQWGILLPETKAKLLCFEARLHLDNICRAKQLADEAKKEMPSYNDARLNSLIAYWETGHDAAIKLLDGQDDVDSLNLKATFFLVNLRSWRPTSLPSRIKTSLSA